MADFRGKLTRFFSWAVRPQRCSVQRVTDFRTGRAVCRRRSKLSEQALPARLPHCGRGTVRAVGRSNGPSVCRFLSRNIAARQRENAAWLGFPSKVKSPFCNCKRTPRPADTETHVFRACPACRSVLRLPRQQASIPSAVPDAGKSFRVRIPVTCPLLSRGVRTAGMPAYNLHINNGRLRGGVPETCAIAAARISGRWHSLYCPV